MRRGLFFFLMVVLVLRGLTGTAMAAGLVQPLAPVGAHPAHLQANPMPADAWGVDATAAIVGVEDASHDHSAHASAADFASDAAHATHAATSCDDAVGACNAQGHHANTCSACEICHSAMLTPPLALTHAVLLPAHTRPLTSAPFHSAPAALAIKPPIA